MYELIVEYGYSLLLSNIRISGIIGLILGTLVILIMLMLDKKLKHLNIIFIVSIPAIILMAYEIITYIISPLGYSIRGIISSLGG